MTTPLKVMRSAVAVLERSAVQYCLIGGHAASLYRKRERFTRDVDFALLAEPSENSKREAESVIAQLGMKPVIGFMPTRGQKRKIAMITSAPAKDELSGIIDILLPSLPWVKEAIERAQENRIDLGFAEIPVITPEDLIVAKCYALREEPQRFQDLDDLREIFESLKSLDRDYIDAALTKHRLKIPQELNSFIPKRFR